MSWRLPDGRKVEQRGSTWLIYLSPGFVEFVGDAEALMAYAKRKGITL